MHKHMKTREGIGAFFPVYSYKIRWNGWVVSFQYVRSLLYALTLSSRVSNFSVEFSGWPILGKKDFRWFFRVGKSVLGVCKGRAISMEGIYEGATFSVKNAKWKGKGLSLAVHAYLLGTPCGGESGLLNVRR